MTDDDTSSTVIDLLNKKKFYCDISLRFEHQNDENESMLSHPFEEDTDDEVDSTESVTSPKLSVPLNTEDSSWSSLDELFNSCVPEKPQPLSPFVKSSLKSLIEKPNVRAIRDAYVQEAKSTRKTSTTIVMKDDKDVNRNRRKSGSVVDGGAATAATTNRKRSEDTGKQQTKGKKVKIKMDPETKSKTAKREKKALVIIDNFEIFPSGYPILDKEYYDTLFTSEKELTWPVKEQARNKVTKWLNENF